MKKPKKTTIVRPNPKVRHKLFWAGLGVVILSGGIFISIFRWTGFRLPKYSLPAITRTEEQCHLALNELANLPPEKLDQIDIAEMNLLCAQELPGSEKINVPDTLSMLDRWAKAVDAETQRNLHRFQANPAEYENSEAYFRMLVLVTVLQQDLHIRYNPQFMELPGQLHEPDQVFLSTSKNVFLTGPLSTERMGTCASLPVLYISVGRRLGYPLYLATTKSHLFVIWDDGKKRLNIEVTSYGMNVYPIEHYMQWPLPMTEQDLKEGRHLRPLTGAEMLAIFLTSRGGVLLFANNRPLAVNCYRRALELAPTWSEIKDSLAYISWPDALPPRTAGNQSEWDYEHVTRESRLYRELHGRVTTAIPDAIRRQANVDVGPPLPNAGAQAIPDPLAQLHQKL